MKKGLNRGAITIAIGICWVFTPNLAFAATRVNVLWLGNSLSTAPWCSPYEGWFADQVMANAVTSKTGIELACYAVMIGGTSISKHYSLQSGFALFDNPIEHRTDDIWQTESVDKYDYVVLQTHTQTASVAAESTALCQYADLALSKGIKPVIFSCWDVPSRYSGAAPAFYAVYNKYKSQGALFAPVFEIHQSINAEKPVTYLYNAGDAYGHATLSGAFVSMSCFYYLFTKDRPSTYDFNVLPQCTGSSAVGLDQAYLTGTIESVLAEYYNLGNTGITAKRSARAPLMETKREKDKVFDISGRSIALPLDGPGMHAGIQIIQQDHNGGITITRK
jgi:hypothetical protein